jgi:hypothetical protein
MQPKWLDWAQRLQAIAQSGLAYAPPQYDLERYEAVREIAAEMMAQSADTEIAPIRDLFASQAGYATPKVDVRAAIFRGTEILLVREREDGCWTLPGGWADIGDIRSRGARSTRGVRVRNARGKTAGFVRPESAWPSAHPISRVQGFLPVRTRGRRSGTQ